MFKSPFLFSFVIIIKCSIVLSTVRKILMGLESSQPPKLSLYPQISQAYLLQTKWCKSLMLNILLLQNSLRDKMHFMKSLGKSYQALEAAQEVFLTHQIAFRWLGIDL